MSITVSNTLERLRYLVGDHVVFIPLALGEKKPTLNGWQKTTFAKSQSENHQRALELADKQGGNIGTKQTSRKNDLTRTNPALP